jgi:hypothetical protein
MTQRNEVDHYALLVRDIIIRIIDCSWALGNRHVVNVGCEAGIHLGLVC